MERIATIQSKMDRWQLAIEWAREHGAKIRRGKVTKQLARVRIYEAKLMKQWNEQFPDLAFDEADVEKSKEFLKDRDAMYSRRKKHRRT